MLTLTNLLQGQIYRHQPLQPGSMENILDVLTGGFVAAASTGQDTFVVRKYLIKSSNCSVREQAKCGLVRTIYIYIETNCIKNIKPKYSKAITN